MGCFLGCFRGRKERKHSRDGASFYAKSKKHGHLGRHSASGLLPASVTSREPVTQTSSRADLFKVRGHVLSESSTSTAYEQRNLVTLDKSPLRSRFHATAVGTSHKETRLQQVPPSSKASEKLKSLTCVLPSTDPWSQVEELEEELQELRRNLGKESDEAKKLRDEINYLRSCGKPFQIPVEHKQVPEISEKERSPERVQEN
eukprot:c17916_g1_i1 orf=488-1093(+)